MELNKVAIQNLFICGKHDCSKNELCSPFIEAVNVLCDLILLEDEFIIAKHQSLMQDALGVEGKVLTNVVDNPAMLYCNVMI